MQHRVDVLRLEMTEQAARLRRRQRSGLDPAPRRLRLQVWGNRQAAIGAGPDDEPLSTPRDVFGDREWGVPELVAQHVRWSFSATADTAAVDDHVPVVSFALDPEFSERDELGLHPRILALRDKHGLRRAQVVRPHLPAREQRHSSQVE